MTQFFDKHFVSLELWHLSLESTKGRDYSSASCSLVLESASRTVKGYFVEVKVSARSAISSSEGRERD